MVEFFWGVVQVVGRMVGVVTAFAVLAAPVVLYVLNVVKLVGMMNGEWTQMVILRTLGILMPPLGCVLGLM